MNALRSQAASADSTCLQKNTGVLFSPVFKAVKVCSARIWYLMLLKESASTGGEKYGNELTDCKQDSIRLSFVTSQSVSQCWQSPQLTPRDL